MLRPTASSSSLLVAAAGRYYSSNHRRPSCRCCLCFVGWVWTILAVVVVSTVSCTSSTTSHDDDGSKHAVVSLVTTHAYVAGALALAASLDQQDAVSAAAAAAGGGGSPPPPSHPDRILLIAKDDERFDVTNQDLNDLEQMGWILHTVDSKACQLSPEMEQMIRQQLPSLLRYWGTCHKFECWNLVQYESVLFIDADSIVLNPYQWIFDLADPERYPNFRLGAMAVPPNHDNEEKDSSDDGLQFQTALLLIRPYESIYQHLKAVAMQRAAPEGELPLLNQVFHSIWTPLPDFTMVAATNSHRPRQRNSNDVDWSVNGGIVTFDFAGVPQLKPWNGYALWKKTGDRYRFPTNNHVPLQPNNPLTQTVLPAQWRWNEFYEIALTKLGRRMPNTITPADDEQQDPHSEL